MREPLLLPMAAMAAGIYLARSVNFSLHEVLGATVCFLVFAVIARKRKARWLARICGILAAVASGCASYEWRRPGPAPVIDASPREVMLIEGCVVEPSAFSDGREQFLLELEPGARARVNLYWREAESPPGLSYGQRVEITGRIRPPRNFDNPGSFDFVRYLARQNTYWTVSAPASSVRILPGPCGSEIRRAIFKLRAAALERVEALYGADTYASGMLKATLLGDSSAIDKLWTENFRRTGTYHALVISGLHVTVLAGVLLFFLRFLPIGELSALLITALLAWLYAFVAGGQAPVMRAAGGFTVYLIARFFYRRTRLLNLLAVVAIGFLLADPEQLFEASFQLSFACVALIGAFGVPLLEATSVPYARGLRGLAEVDRDLHLEPRVAQFRVELRLIAETISLWSRLPHRWILETIGVLLRGVFFLFETAAISAVVQIGLALPMIVYFHRISYTGISANLLVSPALSIAVPVGFAAIFTGSHVLGELTRLLLVFAQRVVDLHASWEGAAPVPDPPLWLAVCFAASLILGFLSIRVKRGRLVSAAVFAVFLALLLLHPFHPRLQPGILELAAIDVGQGESLLAVFPNGKLLLMDGGGIPSFGGRRKPRLDPGEDVVSPYLWSRSIRKVDVIAASHAHEDHIGGLPALITNFRPQEVWTSTRPKTEAWLAVEKAARQSGARIVTLRQGDSFLIGDARIDVLSPPRDYEPHARAHNNDSLVLRLTYGRRRFLLTGDIEGSMEDQLVESGLIGPLDVLKVAHHGSKTSTKPQFLEAARPIFGLVSAGYANSYGVPHRAVLEALRERGVMVFRTDEDGLITMRTDGESVDVDTMRWRRQRGVAD